MPIIEDPLPPGGGGFTFGGGGPGPGGGGGGGRFVSPTLGRGRFMNPNQEQDPRRRRADFFGNPMGATPGGVPPQQSMAASAPQPMYTPPMGPAAMTSPRGGVAEQYLTAADRVNQGAGKFSYTPDYNDPELLGLRSRLQRNQGHRFLKGRDEYARAGLLGSSNMIEGMDALQSQFVDDQLGLDQDVFGRRRGENLGLYRDDLGFRRNAEMGRLGFLGGQENMRLQDELQQQSLGDQLWGTIGGVAGGLGYDWASSFIPQRPARRG